MRESDRVILATIGSELKINMSFTNDISRLEKTLVEIHSRWDPSLRFSQFAQQVQMISSPNLKVQRKRAFLSNLEKRERICASSLDALVELLGPIHGRKTVVFCSGGYPPNASELADRIMGMPMRATFGSPDLGRHLGNSLDVQHRAIDAANRHQVSIYSVDPRGLLTDSMGDTSLRHIRADVRTAVDAGDVTGPQEFLKNLSSGTGGRAFLNSNDLSPGLDRAYQDSSRYYLIGYAPKKRGLYRIVDGSGMNSKMNWWTCSMQTSLSMLLTGISVSLEQW